MATFGGFTAAVLTAAELNTAGGAWSTWTPTIVSWTQGNGTVVAVYEQVGRTVNCFVSIVWGTTSSGFIATVSLPKTAARIESIGAGYIGDSAVLGYPALVVVNTTTTVSIFAHNAAATYAAATAISATIPFTFATSDFVRFSLTYEAAADGT